MFYNEVDGSFQKDVLDVALAVTGSMRLVHELGDEGSGTLPRKI